MKNKLIPQIKGTREWFEANEKQINNSLQGPSVRVLRTKSQDIAYKSPRPLYDWKSEELLLLAKNGLRRPWPSLELPSLALFELEKRHRTSDCETVRTFFYKVGKKPINWLNNLVYWLKLELSKSIKKKIDDRTTKSIYAILIDYGLSNRDYGIYIGSITKTDNGHHDINQEKQVAEHFEGIDSNSDCKIFGVEPLWSISSMFVNSGFTNKQLLINKTKLHTLLKTKVPIVLGERPYLDVVKRQTKYDSLLHKEKY